MFVIALHWKKTIAQRGNEKWLLQAGLYSRLVSDRLAFVAIRRCGSGCEEPLVIFTKWEELHC